jgi:hypothetical protein
MIIKLKSLILSAIEKMIIISQKRIGNVGYPSSEISFPGGLIGFLIKTNTENSDTFQKS